MRTAGQDLLSELTAGLGSGLPVGGGDTPELSTVWTASHVEVALASEVNDRRMRALWAKRRGRRATPLLLVAPGTKGSIRVLGPERGDEPIREVGLDQVLRTLRDLEGKSRRDAVAGLTATLERLDRTGIPGLMVRGLLTKHLLTRRLPRDHPREWRALQEAAEKVSRDASWRENFVALGYVVEERRDRGYLLRAGKDRRPIAVVHPLQDPAAFSKMTAEGSPPEGALVADCRREGVRWGVSSESVSRSPFPTGGSSSCVRTTRSICSAS